MPTIAVPELELFYIVERAPGPPLVFIHGGYCNHRDWTNQVQSLRNEFTILAIDQRGHGASTGDYGQYSVEKSAFDIQSALDRLGFGPAILIGHSMGTRVIMQIAANQPQKTLGIILLDGSRLRSEPLPATPLEPPAVPPDENLRPLIAGAFESMFCDKIDPEVKNTILAEIAATSVADIRALVDAVQAWDIYELDRVLARISDIPAMAVQSTFHDHRTNRYSLASRDESSPWLEFLKSGLHQLEIVVAPNLCHFNMLEDPEKITTEIRRFASRLRDNKSDARVSANSREAAGAQN
jgi:pimeloyl-ACP methyl ester carboxylesterase